MKKEKQSKYYFLLSALSFILANNWHFFSSSSLTPRILDWFGIGMFIYGLTIFFKEEKL